MQDQHGGVPGVFDYNENPLGSMPGEGHLQVPYNNVPDRVLVRVRNVSALQPRTIILESVSIRRGGNQQLKDKSRRAIFGDNVSPVELQFRVAQGDNMNWTEDKLSPVDYILRHNSQRYLIPHTDPKTGEVAPWKPVPAGAWDLYMGNWDAMHAKDRDRTDEIGRLRTRGLDVWVRTEDNMAGILEFEREVIRVETVAVDAQMVSSGRLIEV